MTSIAVKPAPDLDPKAWPLLVHPASGSLLDAYGKVPDEGRPWLNDGFTARMLIDGAIVRAEAVPTGGFTTWATANMTPPAEPAAPEPDPAR